MSAEVIPMRRRRARPLVHLVDSPVAIKMLQQELLTSKLGYTAIATKAMVAHSTVNNIASGQTRFPRLETIIRILSALGWRVVAEKEDDDVEVG